LLSFLEKIVKISLNNQRNKLMFKKIGLLMFLASAAFAQGTPYIGAGLGVQNGGGYNGLYMQGFGGYSTAIKRIYSLAAEVFLNTGSLPLSQKHYNRTTFGLGASLLPGIILNQNSLIYARIGIASFRYTKTDATATGGQLGLGLQNSLTDNWDIRGEYVYTGKSIFKRGFGNSRANFINLALVYKIQ
jgi:opacity protein-like surface antigen